MSLNHRIRELLQRFGYEYATQTPAADGVERKQHILVGAKIADGYYPRDEVGPRTLDFPPFGKVRVWIRAQHVHTFKTSRHRLMCECPRCGHTLSAGRLHQHIGTVACVARRINDKPREVLRRGIPL